MIHLKRLVLGKKIQHLVGFEEELDLSPDMALKGEPLIYDLIRFIEHIGSHKEGHYIAFTRGEEAWNQCDDTNISPVALHDILKCKAYMLLYRAKTTGKHRRADSTTGNADISPEQHAKQHTLGSKKRPPHQQKGPRISGEAAMVVCGSGEGPGTPSPGHGAASGEVKASISRTPPHPTGRVSPLMGERKKRTRTRIEKESINRPKGESASTQDSSLDPTAPLPPPPWAKSTRGKEPDGRWPLHDHPKTAAETRSPDPVETNSFTQTRLQAGIANFHSLCEGSLEQVGLLLSEIAQYPLPPTVVKIILGFKNDADAQLFPELFTTSQLSTAILDSDDNITPQWYIEEAHPAAPACHYCHE